MLPSNLLEIEYLKQFDDDTKIKLLELAMDGFIYEVRGCPCRLNGLDRTRDHNRGSGILFYSQREYLFEPCLNHVELYHRAQFERIK